VCKITEKQKA